MDSTSIETFSTSIQLWFERLSVLANLEQFIGEFWLLPEIFLKFYAQIQTKQLKIFNQ